MQYAASKTCLSKMEFQLDKANAFKGTLTRKLQRKMHLDPPLLVVNEVHSSVRQGETLGGSVVEVIAKYHAH